MKFAKFLLSGFFYVILYILTYLIHINFFEVNVVFYAAIIDGIIAALFMLIILNFTNLFKIFNSFDKFQLFCIFLLVGYSIAISIPTVIDRSLTFYILEKIQQRGGGIKFDQFEQVFTKEYVKEHRLLDVRITEQVESGTIKLENGCVKITDKGKRISSFSRYFRLHFLPKKRLLMGEYSDDLTNPFRSSIESPDYQCH